MVCITNVTLSLIDTTEEINIGEIEDITNAEQSYKDQKYKTIDPRVTEDFIKKAWSILTKGYATWLTFHKKIGNNDSLLLSIGNHTGQDFNWEKCSITELSKQFEDFLDNGAK